jgi:gas vesicle protein
MRNYNSGAAVGAFLTGALVGGVIALLFAPRSGAETRGMIRDFVEDEVDMVKDKAAAARDYVEDQVDRYKRKARRAAHNVEEWVEGAKERVEDEIHAMRKSVERC